MLKFVLPVYFAFFMTVKTFAADSNVPVVNLLCVTNLPAGKHVMFGLTNFTSADLVVAPFLFEEQQTNGMWTTNSFLTARSSLANTWRQKWIGLREELLPGQGFSFLVPIRTNNLPWRITFHCGQRMPVTDAVRDFARHVTATNDAMRGSKLFSGKTHWLTTPVIRDQD